MSTRSSPRRIRFPSRPQTDFADESVEFVLDEDEAQPCDEIAAMTLERVVPALQEYLRDIAELDALVPSFRAH